MTRDLEAERFVDAAIKGRLVVMFALKWSAFTWVAPAGVYRTRIAYFAVDLSARAPSNGTIGADAFAVRYKHAPRSTTIPQIFFVVGDDIGGAGETLDAWRTGRLGASTRR